MNQSRPSVHEEDEREPKGRLEAEENGGKRNGGRRELSSSLFKWKAIRHLNNGKFLNLLECKREHT